MNKIKIIAEKWVNNGVCIGYHENETYFIIGTIPGETVICEIIKNTSKLKLLKTISVEESSELRISSDCEIFLICGGCQFRHISYSEELTIKEELLRKELKWENAIQIYSDNPTGYRNNAQIKFSEDKFGFYKLGSNDLVSFPSYGCKNLPDELNMYLTKLKKNFYGEKKFRLQENSIVEYSAIETSYSVNGYRFAIPPNGFFQINRYLISNWIQQIISVLPDKNSESILELFSGCGLISICISDYIHSAHCFEIDNSSVSYAKKNANANGKKNLSFQTSNLYNKHEKNLENFSRNHWIANPPRNGLGTEIIKIFCEKKPKSLIYSSCNYVTLAQDLKKILPHGYKISHVSLFDFFPRTHYFETLVKIEKL